MKLLTLNTHSLQEKNNIQKRGWFVETVLREKPDIIALQEVNQSCDAPLWDTDQLAGQYPTPGTIPIRQDNHAAHVARQLTDAGLTCYWVWIPIKRGYGKYDEGVAIFSLGRSIRSAEWFPVSKTRDYSSWRTRAALGIQVEGLEDWFYSLHMGWWDDGQDPFLDQWKRLNSCIMSKRMCGPVWLLGDLNAPDNIQGQSYSHIVGGGWFDTHQLACTRDDGITTSGSIDGWRLRQIFKKEKGLRLDYILCSREQEVRSSRVLFNGIKEPVVSDHYGVMIETKES